MSAPRHQATSSSSKALASFQIERVEALREPAVDRSEKMRQEYNDPKKGRPKA